ncbi:MAG TPA: xanthine dehydrogenase family protein subunit M [Methylomirabilota bacterium]|jgi:carbon-monoxide dehydrogenase medium subunit
MLRPFALHRPGTAEEACALLARFGEDAAPYAGGTELLLLMKLGVLRPRHLVDVKRLPGFDAITDGGRLTLGAAVTHRAVERSSLLGERAPLVAAVARHVANVRVRNVGTVGGNLAFADPHSDLATLFLTLDATVTLVSPRGHRELALADFTRGAWDTAREIDELLTSVRVTPWPAGTAAVYLKFGVHERPTLGVALALVLDARRAHVTEARLAIGCVDPRPVRVPSAEARLRGTAVAELEDAAGTAGELASAAVEPDDDLHGSADYKREMVAVFVRRALRVAVQRARDAAAPLPKFPYTVIA